VLIALRVRDFILIDSLELRLEPGYNVLTGETGAGKSIVIGALALVLGRRARADMIRPGAQEAEVEALFDISGSELIRQLLAQRGLASGDELVIRRVVQPNGRSRAYLNGRLCTVAELAELALELADVTSQHESVALADPRRHLGYLDRYASLTTDRDQLARQVDELLQLDGEIRQVTELERTRIDREGFLQFQLQAIEELAPRPGEDDELRVEIRRLKHAERLREVSARVAEQLDQAENALCDELAKLGSDLSAAAELDPALRPAAEEVEDCWSRLREVAADMARYAERTEADPERLEEAQSRVFGIESLLRRHGPQIEDVLSAQQRLTAELAEIAGAEARLPELQQRRRQLLDLAGRQAQQLSRRRREAARQLSRAISGELAELGMGKARVLVEVTTVPDSGDELAVDGARLGRDGIDRVQFLIAPNPGLEPQPLGRIASGGELSRALLALKRALGGYDSAAEPARKRGTGVQVFDEVDAGVGGATADRIGRSIANIAAHRQVLCITHLAPLASHAEAHFVVTKKERQRSTVSTIERVEGKQRVEEIARMLTGEQITRSSLKAARDLLAAAR